MLRKSGLKMTAAGITRSSEVGETVQKGSPEVNFNARQEYPSRAANPN
jgi:hypothetical protein